MREGDVYRTFVLCAYELAIWTDATATFSLDLTLFGTLSPPYSSETCKGRRDRASVI